MFGRNPPYAQISSSHGSSANRRRIYDLRCPRASTWVSRNLWNRAEVGVQFEPWAHPSKRTGGLSLRMPSDCLPRYCWPSERPPSTSLKHRWTWVQHLISISKPPKEPSTYAKGELPDQPRGPRVQHECNSFVDTQTPGRIESDVIEPANSVDSAGAQRHAPSNASEASAAHGLRQHTPCRNTR